MTNHLGSFDGTNHIDLLKWAAKGKGRRILRILLICGAAIEAFYSPAAN